MLACSRYRQRSLLPLLIVAGCGSSDHAPAWSVDTLATGAVVARNSPAWNAESGEWQLRLVVRIGQLTGSGPSTFGQVCDVVLGPDELIYALDCLADEVRVFNTEGAHIRTIGAAGEGPGEFQAPYALAFDPEGHLWVVDENERRYTVFDTDGALIRVLRKPIRWPVTTGVLHFSQNGTLYEYGWWSNGPGGVIRMVADSIVKVQDTVPLPAWDVHSFSNRMRPQLRSRVPFSPRHVVDVGSGGEIWTGLGEDYRFARIADGGDTLQIVELAVQPTPLSESDQVAAQDMADRAVSRGFEVDETRIPSVHPYFTSLVVAANGDIWVRRTTDGGAVSTDHVPVYDVFDRQGHYLATVPAPVHEFPAPHISEQFLVGVTRDELDVEYVELYRIQRDQ